MGSLSENNEAYIKEATVTPSLSSEDGNHRSWSKSDAATFAVLILLHLLCLFAPFAFTWGAFWVGFGLYVVTGLVGITFSYHRNLAHRSFQLPKWLEYACAYCGLLALQGAPIQWVRTHRYHHTYSDKEKDPHSPINGFWFSHVGWFLDSQTYRHIDWFSDNKTYYQKFKGHDNVADLKKQPFYQFLQNTQFLHHIALGVLLYALGGYPYIMWGMVVRLVWVFHITWSVNSVCHIWGTQAWNTGDLSRNNWWVALLAFGEGWHNNHHAFEYSARHGLEWWQIDTTWYLVRLLEAIGLATHVKLPGAAHKEKMALSS